MAKRAKVCHKSSWNLPVPCTNKCDAKMLRQSLACHLARDCPRRSHTCPHCNLIGEYQNITGRGHLNTCFGVLISCTLCTKKVKRILMEAHLVKCKVESVPCQYQSVGCTARPKRQDLSQHNLKAMSDHLLLAVTAIANQRTELGQQTKAIAQQRTEIAELRREHQEIKNSFLSKGSVASVTLKMENVSKFLSAETKEKTWNSGNFSIDSTMEYNARLRVDLNGAAGADSKFASCYICFIGEECDTRPFRGTFTVSILNHSENGKDYSRQLSSEKGAQSISKLIIGEKEFIEISDLLAQNKQSLYLKEDCLFFKVTVDNVLS